MQPQKGRIDKTTNPFPFQNYFVGRNLSMNCAHGNVLDI